jgi:DNA-binding NtrC family response regulator
VLFRAAVFCDGDALTSDFPAASRHARQAENPTLLSTPVQESGGRDALHPDGNLRPLEEIEADVIRLAIGHYRGRMTEVARRLGIGRSTLYRKLAELGLEGAA